jgi:tRNA (mo5U34)-methyltransferase
MSRNRRSIRSRVAQRLPRGRAVKLGALSIRQQWDGVLVGPTAVHPAYGSLYRVKPLPVGLTTEELQEYVSRTSWYHEIDLGNGVTTKPAAKARKELLREWNLFALGDLTHKTVLDIGGLDGGYAFLAEQSGASRVAVLDHYIWSTDSDEYGRIYSEGIATGATPPAPHESKAWHPDTMPTRWRFDIARQALNSRVEAIPLDFMDCNLAGVGTWDIVLYLGVLYHMQDPIGAMRRVAAVTAEQCIIETEAMFIPGHPEALWRFFPAGELNNDKSNWWVPNLNALVGITAAAGFSNVEVLVGEPVQDENMPPAGPCHYRAIVRALKER